MSRRTAAWILALALTTVSLSFGVAAVHDAALLELDGDVADGPVLDLPHDWASLFDADGTLSPVLPPEVVVATFSADHAEPDHSFHATGDKDVQDITDWDCTVQNNVLKKNNVLNGYAALYNKDGGAYLYFGFEREDNAGDANMGVWFLRSEAGCTPPAQGGGSDDFTGVHMKGDLFLLADFTNGGTIAGLKVYQWNPAFPDNLELLVSGADCSTAGPDDLACGLVNTGDISTPWEPGTSSPLGANQFFEGGLNLTGLAEQQGLGGIPCFGTYMVETRTSQSLTATLKDFIGANFETCDARITIDPQEDTNVITDAHDFTVTVEYTTGVEWLPAVGVLVNASIVSGPGAFVGPASCTTNATGQCVVTITSAVTGDTVVSASADVPVSDQVLHRETDGVGDNSGPALKHWVRAPTATITTPYNLGDVGGSAITNVTLGQGVQDQGVVVPSVDGPIPTGSVDFYVCDPRQLTPAADAGTAHDVCTQPNGTFLGTVALNEFGEANSPAFYPTYTGLWCFRSEYSGDASYLPSLDDGQEQECFQVHPADSTTVTVPTASSITLGGSVADTVHVSGLGDLVDPPVDFPDPTGSVDFYVCGPAQLDGNGTCSGGAFVSTEPLDAGGNATSDPVTPTSAGVWCFRGEYSGDANYAPSADHSLGECFVVHPAPSDSTTTPIPDIITLGASASDHIVVTGNDAGGTPTGTVDFYVCDASELTGGECVNGGSFVSTESLDGDGKATSDPFTPLAAGVWCFRGEYGGDANYNASVDHATSECFVVLKAPSDTVTTPSNASIALGGTVHDAATVTGLGGDFPDPTGTVDFYVCGPTDTAVECASGGSFLGTVALDNGSADSPDVTPLATGFYCFRGEYGGDANHNASEDHSLGECFEVTRAPSQTVTTPSNASIVLGDTVHDAATVTGLGGDYPDPTGTVDFYICGPTDTAVECASGGESLGTVALSGGEASSPDVTPLATGFYCFRGEYGGDANYEPSEDHSLGECFEVTRAPSQTVTTPSNASIVLGGTVHDAATVTGLGGDFPDPTGTVDFYVCGPTDSAVECASGGDLLGTVALDNGSADSPDVTPLATGFYCFRGEYLGDSNYEPSTDHSLGECYEATQAPSTAVTTPSASSIVLGDSVSDHVEVFGLGGDYPVPTGTVDFYVCAPGDLTNGTCESGGTFVSSEALVNGSADSDAVTPSHGGDWCFRAEYAGDANYEPSVEFAVTECFAVEPAESQTVTTPSTSEVVLGDSVHDAATVTGLGGDFPDPTGTVDFYVCAPSQLTNATCESGGTFVSSETLVNGSAQSDPVFPDEAGTWCFRGEYRGDANHEPSADHSLGECFLVLKAPSVTITTPYNLGDVGGSAITNATLGDGVQDQGVVLPANLQGPIPTGSVDFYVCAPSQLTPAADAGTAHDVCTQPNGTFLGTVALNEFGEANSPAFYPTYTGLWCFRSEYSGDDYYLPSLDDGQEQECFQVHPAESTIVTVPVQDTIDLGGAIQDTAFVTGLDDLADPPVDFPTPTGSVQFWICGPTELFNGGCPDGAGMSLGNVSLVDGMAVSPGFVPDEPGFWCFRATYHGDANHSASSDVGNAGECVFVEGLLPCPHTIGFWKNHEEDWPVDVLMLGDRNYTKEELLDILNSPTRGDARIILAHQLIAAKLNLASGWAESGITPTVTEADALLAGDLTLKAGKVKPSSDLGGEMVAAGALLTDYNEGTTSPGCNGSLSLEKEADGPALGTDGNVSFSVSVTSGGPGAVLSVFVNDTLPAPSGDWVLSDDAGGACGLLAGVVSCFWAQLDAGASVSFEVTAALGPADCGATFDNTATGAALVHERDWSDYAAADGHTVVCIE